MNHNGHRKMVVIVEGDRLAHLLPDGTVRLGEVQTPAKGAGKSKVMRPKITWSETLPIEAILELAQKMETEVVDREAINY